MCSDNFLYFVKIKNFFLSHSPKLSCGFNQFTTLCSLICWIDIRRHADYPINANTSKIKVAVIYIGIPYARSVILPTFDTLIWRSGHYNAWQLSTWGAFYQVFCQCFSLKICYKLLKSLHLIGWEQICQWKNTDKTLDEMPPWSLPVRIEMLRLMNKMSAKVLYFVIGWNKPLKFWKCNQMSQ